MAAETVFVELRAIISEFQARMAEARGEMEETQKAGSGHFNSLGKFAGTALVGVAAAGVGIAAVAVKMGNELEDAHVKLAQALKDSGASFVQFAPQIKAADKAMENLGFTNAQTEAALANGVTGTGSATKALNLLQTAANLAAYKHMDLAQAMTIVVRASEGQQRPLKQLGIDLPIVASNALKVKQAQDAVAKAQQAVNAILQTSPTAVEANSKAHAKYEAALQKVRDAQLKLNEMQTAGGQIIDALNRKIGGQAAAAADTFSGRMQVMRARVEDVGAKIGIALIPILEQLMTDIAALVGWLDKHRTVALALAAAIGTVLVAATIAWVAALSPVILITGGVVAAIVGMIAVGTLLYQNWDRVLAFLRSGFGTLAQVILLGPFAILTLLALHWREVWGGIQAVVHDVVGVVMGIVNSFVGFFTGLPNRIANIAATMWNGISEAFKATIDTVIGWWDDFVSYLKIPGFKVDVGPIHVGWGGLDLGSSLKIPMLASGTDWWSGGLAMVGERGPELVNLPRGSSVTPNSKLHQPTIVVLQINQRELGRVVLDDLLQQQRNRPLGIKAS